jgi:hypothetical protein
LSSSSPRFYRTSINIIIIIIITLLHYHHSGSSVSIVTASSAIRGTAHGCWGGGQLTMFSDWWVDGRINADLAAAP